MKKEKKQLKGKKSPLPGQVDQLLDETGEESFPSSDPPAWTLGSHYQLEPLVKNGLDMTHLIAHEHNATRKVVASINKLVEAVQQAKPINKTVFKNLSGFLHLVAEHCLCQEKILFPALKKGEERPSNYLLNDLKQEHQHEIDLLTNFDATSQKYAIRNVELHKRLIALLRNIQHLYLNHVDKEEEYILPLINKSIGKEEQRKLLEELNEKEPEKNHKELMKLGDKVVLKLKNQ